MIEKQEMIEIGKGNLLEMVAALRAEGYRLVQICATTLSDCYELNYSFDKDRQFRNLRFTVRPDESVPSISMIYSCAFLSENEIHDLFGIPIEHITVDYHGTLYFTRIPAPFSIKTRIAEEAAPEARPEKPNA